MKLPSRKFFLKVVLSSLAVTALLGIIAIITSDLGGIGSDVLSTTVAVDIVSVIALCCVGKPVNMFHRVLQMIGLLAAAVSLVFMLILIWVSGLLSQDAVLRSFGVAEVVAIVAAHSCLLLPSIKRSRALFLVTSLTIVCIVIAGELIANFFLIPGFDPGLGYIKAIGVILILDVLGTISIPLLRRFGSAPATVTASPVPASNLTFTPDNPREK